MTRKPRHLDQWVLVVLGIVVAGVLLVAPLVLIFVEALSGGWSLLVINLQRDYMRSAILLTLVAAGLSVPVNVVFGILLAWCVTRFRFRGRTLTDTQRCRGPLDPAGTGGRYPWRSRACSSVDRALGSGPKGRRFESCRARQ